MVYEGVRRMYSVYMSSVLGDLVKQRRLALKMTQRQLGKQVGLTHQQIGNIEDGSTKLPGPESLQKLASALQIAEERLLQAVGFLQNRVQSYFPTPRGPAETWAEIVEAFDGDEDEARRWLISVLGRSVEADDDGS